MNDVLRYVKMANENSCTIGFNYSHEKGEKKHLYLNVRSFPLKFSNCEYRKILITEIENFDGDLIEKHVMEMIKDVAISQQTK